MSAGREGARWYLQGTCNTNSDPTGAESAVVVVVVEGVGGVGDSGNQAALAGPGWDEWGVPSGSAK